MKTLVVEDDVVSSTLLTRILSKYGTTEVATDGKAAMEFVCKALRENEPYDLICLDMLIPEMNGQEVLEELRQIEEANTKYGSHCSKVIMISSSDDSAHIMQAFRSQAEAYLLKPIDPSKLLSELRSLNLIE